MRTREEAIKFLKDTMKEHQIIELGIIDGTATWKHANVKRELTPEEWKHIGYVSAIAWAYDIKDLSL